MKAVLNKDGVFSHSHFRGAHTYTDAHLFISGKGRLGAATDLSIESVPGVIVSYFSISGY
jgi:hypothetical protein